MSDNDSEQRDDELRALGVETRSANVSVGNVDFGQRIITVIAAPYEETTLVPFLGNVWSEVISRSAFAGFDASKRRVPATASLVIPNPNHEQGRLVGRVINAYPDRQEGLITDIKISRSESGDETLALAEDRAISASVGMMVKDPRRDQRLDHGTRTRRIDRAFLDHVAFVAQPAYAGAEILAMRSDALHCEPGLPILAKPGLEEFYNDPIFRRPAK